MGCTPQGKPSSVRPAPSRLGILRTPRVWGQGLGGRVAIATEVGDCVQEVRECVYEVAECVHEVAECVFAGAACVQEGRECVHAGHRMELERPAGNFPGERTHIWNRKFEDGNILHISMDSDSYGYRFNTSYDIGRRMTSVFEKHTFATAQG